jgi:glucoamylase
MSANVASSGVIRSGLDSNTVLASIHNFDPAAGCDSTTFQPCSDRALANLVAYVRSFASVYPINSGIPLTSPLAVGRYAEDVYYDGNPWYLSVFAVAEQLYDALYVWDRQGSLSVTSISLPFFAQFDSTIKTGTYKSSSSTYKALVKAISAYADGYIALNAKYTPADGSLTEQFNKTTGVPASAVHLTWSYASALTAFYARDASLIPTSWGAKDLKVPSVCLPGPPQPTAKVTFNVVATTVEGESIFIVGSVDELKNWSPPNGIALSSAKYPTWSGTLTSLMYQGCTTHAHDCQ